MGCTDKVIDFFGKISSKTCHHKSPHLIVKNIKIKIIIIVQTHRYIDENESLFPHLSIHHSVGVVHFQHTLSKSQSPRVEFSNMDHQTVQSGCSDGSKILPISNTQDNGMPDANLQLSFPELVEVYIKDSTGISSVADPLLSLYDQMPTCCPKIEELQFGGDPTLTNFPNNFSSISTTLKRFVASLIGKQTVKFPSHPSLAQLELFGDETTTEIVIDDNVLLPNLNETVFGVVVNENHLQTISNFTAKSFPALRLLYLLLPFSIPPIHLNLDLPSLYSLFVPQTDLTTQNTIIHFNDTKGPVVFTGVEYDSTVYPFLNGYPPNVEYIDFRMTSINNIPPVVIPSSATSINLTGCPITLPIDFNTVLQNTTGNLELIFFGNGSNPSLVGPLSQETALCRLKGLQLEGTGVTSIPDCFWCYQNEPTVRFAVPASVVFPVGFTCPITFTSTNLVTVFKKAIIKGKNLGWGANVGGNTLVPIVPNEQLQATINGVATDGPPQNISIQFSNDYPAYTYPFKVMEAGFNVTTTTATQEPNHITITITFSTVNTNILHFVSINGKFATIAVINNVPGASQFGFTPTLSTGTYNVTIFNAYYSVTVPNVQYIQSYPIVNNIISDSIILNGSIIQLEVHQSPFKIVNSQYNYSVCSITEFTTTRISCKVESPISSGLATFNITVDGYSILKQYTIQSAQQQCESETNHCANNGVCTPDGICDCNANQGGYYNNCSKRMHIIVLITIFKLSYPFATSGQVNDQNTTQRSISLFGDFGPNALTNSSVRINNTMNCIINQLESTQFTIQCQLESSPTIYGPASVQLNVDGLLFDSKTYLIRFIKPSTGGKMDKEICEESTQYCFGHGTCDDNGICQCQSGFNPVDNCLTKFVDNSSYIPNPESPSTNISVDGVEFGFDILAIQEIGLDNEIVKELLTNSWISNITTNSTFTDAVYQLVISNTSILADTQVTVNITFSTQSRSITFGNQQLLINPNSIKLAVSINGWEYSSNVATLRVVLKTTTNNQQSIEYDCKETNVDSFSYDDYGTLQYLRVLKDNVQFNGRFIDFALADGRTTYSQTLLINQTSINDEELVAMIGITLPQCQSCVLDPDFTPLLVVNDKDGDCSSTDNNKWKIIVGSVVGGIILVSIITTTTVYIKKKIVFKKHNKKLEMKLNLQRL
ncbi:hypothetical protein DFA_05158 [Cavenderia fasciculata]|uniref:EGF-like domain-containing protein n=1 Tax=Cavenderia fasciculata TaxID=261658 RepID=F4PNH5_CACFS|nr:uncharacterized protein DFA_05158 [Cavenderia fasciculata]EGG23028.1 hypothetical protein DFA_05158 [Cavenderia fasciculata]|eukprot:XP_004360879.1 hypothetical protein DFA_05158 [Cavenderia fasciculata]